MHQMVDSFLPHVLLVNFMCNINIFAQDYFNVLHSLMCESHVGGSVLVRQVEVQQKVCVLLLNWKYLKVPLGEKYQYMQISLLFALIKKCQKCITWRKE